MKRKNVKKLFAIVLTAGMILGTLAGCASTEEKAEDTAAKDTAVEESAKEEAPAENENAEAENADPIVITCLTSTNPVFGDWNEYYVIEKLEEDLNVDLQIEIVPGDVWAEKSALYFASDEVPDIIFGGIDAGLYGTQGYLLDMSEYISEELTPNISYAFKTVPDLKRAATELDGSLYRIYGYTAQLPELGRQRHFIQTKWCQEILGKDKPDTLDELTTFLKEVRDRDMDGDGDPNNEIPIGGCYANARQIDIRTIVLSAMGHVTTNNLMEVDEDGKTAIFVPAHEDYKEFLKYMNMLWEEELLDHEYFTQDGDQNTAKEIAGVYGVFGNWSSNNAPDYAENYDMLKPLTSELNDTPVAAAGNIKLIGEMNVSATTEHPEECMKVIDWFFDQERGNLILGSDVKMGDDPDWPDYGTKYEYDEEQGFETWVWYGPNGKGDIPENFVPQHIAPYPECLPLFNEFDYVYYPEQKGNIHYQVVVNCVPYYKSVFPSVKFKAEEESERALIFTDIDAYYKEMETRMITGDLDVEENWDTYVQGLKDRGLDRYVEIYQNGLDAWLSN